MTPTLRFLLRRLGQAIPIIIGIAVFNFFLLHMAPGDAVDHQVMPDEQYSIRFGGAHPEQDDTQKQSTGEIELPLPVSGAFF